MKQGQFEQYVNLIRKSAHFYANKYNIDYDEIESQGFLIYCQCLESYDVAQSQFSTHLSWELKRLNDFCKTYLRQQGMLMEDEFKSYCADESESVYEKIPAKSDNISLTEILQIAFKQLSKEAYPIFEWILGRTWETKGKLKPSITLAMSQFNLSREQTKILWNEIGNFYHSNLCTL